MGVESVVRSGEGSLAEATVGLFLDGLHRRRNCVRSRMCFFDWCEAEVFGCKDLVEDFVAEAGTWWRTRICMSWINVGFAGVSEQAGAGFR